MSTYCIAEFLCALNIWAMHVGELCMTLQRICTAFFWLHLSVSVYFGELCMTLHVFQWIFCCCIWVFYCTLVNCAWLYKYFSAFFWLLLSLWSAFFWLHFLIFCQKIWLHLSVSVHSWRPQTVGEEANSELAKESETWAFNIFTKFYHLLHFLFSLSPGTIFPSVRTPLNKSPYSQ